MRITLFKKYFLVTALFLSVLTNIGFAQKRELAITIDDLPFVGDSKNFHLDMIINAIKIGEIPATGFIIAGQVEKKNWQMLHKFRDAGLELGNHTLSHANLNKMDSDSYIHEIDAADKILTPVLTEPKYFRYPYLAMSDGAKKDKILNHLASKNYHIAPITIDSRDFVFNQLLLAVPERERRTFLNVLKPCYLNFIWQQTLKAEEIHHSEQAQILLIHANLLNAYVLPDIINLYKQNGFTFVSLGEALKTLKVRGKAKAASQKPKVNTNDTTDEEGKIEGFMAWN